MCISLRKAALATIVAAGLAGCRSPGATVRRSPLETLDDALEPGRLAALLRKQGGAHVHASAAFHVDLAHSASGTPASPPTITTTTDLWLDKKGNFRLQELNDQDGGRDIARVDNELAVALRYGKTVRRPAQDAESTRYLAEAVGAPWSCWEIVRRQVEVQAASAQPDTYTFHLGSRKVAPPLGFAPAEGLRAWRASVTVKSIEGQVTLAPGSHLPLAFTCLADYQATRDAETGKTGETGEIIEGNVAVTLAVDELGKTADVVMPESEPLQARQRTILEERALLGGIRSASSAAHKPSP